MTSWSPGGQNAGNQNPYGQNAYGQNASNQNAYGQSPYGQDPYGAGPQDPYAGQALPASQQQYPQQPGGWGPGPYQPPQQQPGVPGALIGGSVVGYLLAVFVFITGLMLVFFGSVFGSIDELDSSLGDGGVSLVVAGLGNWIAAGLLIAGWVLATLRRPAGLLLSLAGSGMVLALAVYWVVLYPVSGIVVWAVVHVVIAAVPAGLALIPANRTWMETAAPRPGQQYPVDPYGRPYGA